MASRIVSTGAANIFVTGNGSSTLVYLGCVEDSVDITFTAKFKVVSADYAGGPDGIPADELFMGEMASIKMTLSRFEQSSFNLLASRFNNNSSVAGSVGILQIGTLMSASGNNFRLLIYPQRASIDASVPVYNFPNVIVDTDITLNYSTRNLLPQLLFTAYPLWSIDSGSNSFTGFTYNGSSAGMPSIT